METGLFNSSRNQTLGTLVLIMLIIALGAYVHYTLRQAKYLYTGPVTISVNGEGEVMAVPDIGQFSFAVTASGEDAATAQSESANKMNAVLDFLKNEGVEEKDIKTESYNMYPKYRYEPRPCPAGSFCPNEQVFDGFEVSQTVSVKVRDIQNAGVLIANVGDLGATNISGLNFTIDDTDRLMEEARVQAIADAKAKAKVLSDELGVRFVEMVGYHENDGYYPMPYFGRGGDMVEMGVKDMMAPSLPTGENVVRSQVTITYKVR